MAESARDLNLNPAEQVEPKQEHPNGAQRLLPGETPLTLFREDAVHWQSVYTELLHFKAGVLETMRKEREALSDPAVLETAHDVTLMQRQQQRYQQRLAFWNQREQELRGARPR